MGTWHDPDVGRPIAAPLEQCAELLGVDLATVRELAANLEPERQLRPEAHRRRRGGYLDHRRIPAADTKSIPASVLRHTVREVLRPFGPTGV